jgi:hypothetical protein
MSPVAYVNHILKIAKISLSSLSLDSLVLLLIRNHWRGLSYCNVLAGSISQWNFITLKIQYTIVNHNPQRF